MATRTTKRSLGRTKGDVRIVELIDGFIEDADARSHVRENLNAFCRVAQTAARASRIARRALAAF